MYRTREAMGYDLAHTLIKNGQRAEHPIGPRQPQAGCTDTHTRTQHTHTHSEGVARASLPEFSRFFQNEFSQSRF